MSWLHTTRKIQSQVAWTNEFGLQLSAVPARDPESNTRARWGNHWTRGFTRLSLHLAADQDSDISIGTTNRAIRMGVEPHINTRNMERMRTQGQNPHILPIPELAQAHRAGPLLNPRLGIARVLARRNKSGNRIAPWTSLQVHKRPVPAWAVRPPARTESREDVVVEYGNDDCW